MRSSIFASCLVFGAALWACGPASPGSPDPGEETGEVSQALGTTCWAQILRPIPNDAYVQVGTQLTLRVSATQTCPDGVSPEPLAYRFYVEGPNGRYDVVGANTWTTSRSIAFPTTGLPEGRYRIYAYSLPQRLISAWQANDPDARIASTRSGNTYTQLVTNHWSTSAWSTCSKACGGGTQTRAVTCVDGSDNVLADASCLMTKPATSQACQTASCLSPNTLVVGGEQSTFTVQTETTADEWAIYGGNAGGKWIVVAFPAKPTQSGDWATAGQWDATHAYVEVTDEASGGWWNSDLGHPVVYVRRRTLDGKLHVIVDDPALNPVVGASSVAVRADLTID